MSNKDTDRPKPEEKVCYNCKHMLWMVAIGLGVRCGYEIEGRPKMTMIPNLRHPWIPNLRHTCDNFRPKKQD